MQLTNRQLSYVNAIITHAPGLGIDTNKVEFSRAELRQISMTEKGKIWIPNWITHDVSRRVSRGVFSIPEVQEQIAVAPGHETDTDLEQDSAPVPTPATPEVQEEVPSETVIRVPSVII